MKKIVWLVLLLAFFGTFKVGCENEAQAANVMLTATSGFKVIDNIVITNLTPTLNSTGNAMNVPITMDVKHALPIVTTSLAVKANGTPIAGSLVVTTITGGKHLVWTPAAEYPMFSDITWVLNVEVNNGL
jgi:hypothetical protein